MDQQPKKKKKLSFGPNFEYGDIPKNPNMLFEHANELPNASTKPLSEFQQPGGTKNQNSNHTPDFEGSRRTYRLKSVVRVNF